MKYIKIILLCAVMIMTASCYKDEPNRHQSIFDEQTSLNSPFDKWLLQYYTIPYNIEFNYLYNDNLTDHGKNVIPAELDKAKTMALLIKHVWMDAYAECVGEDFLKKHCFRVFQLIGSPQYDTQGSIVLGTAEGGIQVTLFRINELDKDNIYVNLDEPYRSHAALPLDLNYWYFHTMHHEFCHILTQLIDYPTEFKSISAGDYKTTGWVNVEDTDAAKMGFVTGYSTMEPNEDFVEIYSTYVTSSDKAWNTIVMNGVDGEDTSGALTILQKLEIVRTYLADSWGIDLEELRSIVLRRSAEAATLLDSTTLQ